MKTAYEITVISHNLFAMKFYMSDNAPSIVTLTLLTVIVKCTQKNKLFSLLGICVIKCWIIHKDVFSSML